MPGNRRRILEQGIGGAGGQGGAQVPAPAAQPSPSEVPVYDLQGNRVR